MMGVRADGHTILRLRNGADDVILDTVFMDTPRNDDEPKDLKHVKYIRTDIVIRPSPYVNDDEFYYQHWDSEWETDDYFSELSIPLDFKRQIICGTQLVAYNKTDGTFLICTGATSSSPTRTERTVPSDPVYAINETLLAYIATTPENQIYIRLKRTNDLENISEYRDIDVEEFRHSRGVLEMTRFSLILVGRKNTWVFDLKLNFLFKVPRTMSMVVDEQDVWCEYLHTDDWGLLFGTTYNASSVLCVLDVKARRYRWLVSPKTVEEERDGYYFSTIEYPVDEEGRRTGATGSTRHYWRWLKDAGQCWCR
ncbi:hypothetical protein HDV00_008097 [Rhizophlyctis rosea]|nr:hypothetical protein HDV00_008097 [Rhizophlyctis rosea]